MGPGQNTRRGDLGSSALEESRCTEETSGMCRRRGASSLGAALPGARRSAEQHRRSASRSSESRKKDKSGSDKTTRSNNASVARVSQEPTQQAETIAYALLGRCAAYAGRCELGACRSHRASESASPDKRR